MDVMDFLQLFLLQDVLVILTLHSRSEKLDQSKKNVSELPFVKLLQFGASLDCKNLGNCP